MNTLNINQLSTQEIVERFFTDISVAQYAYAFVQRPDSPDEIRKYITKNGLDSKRILFAKFVQLENFAENDAICELMDTALCAWSASFQQDGEMCRFTSSFSTYLSEIAHYVSREHKRRYGSFDEKRGDWMLVERLKGAQHLNFLANHLNKHFKDPKHINQWNLVFAHCFQLRSTPADASIASLFCHYMLESENDNPRLPFYSKECGTSFKLSLPVIRFNCINGLTAIRHDLWGNDLYGQAEFASTLYNVVKAIWRYRLYEDFSEEECAHFRDALVLYSCFSTGSDMQDFLKDGDETFIRMAISAWSNVFEQEKQIIVATQEYNHLSWTKFLETPPVLVVAGRCIRKSLPRLRAFLLSVPASKVGACSRDWEQMQQNITILAADNHHINV
ncbi:hypothetical protein M2454_000023 [Aequitasia blattaphilus]|uniref:Uncharacterized protein n=1 Tax=Aequitasia blattaphilus TaxID=2949332 RepID=A0ABT1E772_9FIRM|nr:hypothetical protein [Aequitasia blattaphilus]MCP1100817.1 hypothetical protein [Aequitasia blattaphilus]MCR8613457.1 hypothetical protein [Aequitasia blattaphilus]